MLIQILIGLGLFFLLLLLLLFIYERFFQTKNIVRSSFPLLGNFRYFFHELRPFFRQYFGDDNAFAPREIIEWILNVSSGKTGYFAFDKFDTTGKLTAEKIQMIHAPYPKNEDEMRCQYPILGEHNRKHPLAFNGYFYRSAMSLGALSFEATAAMFSACADTQTPANTGEGGFSVHHIPRLPYNPSAKFWQTKKVPVIFRIMYFLAPGKRLKNRTIDFLGFLFCEKQFRDAYLFDQKHFVFYKINWQADLKYFPKTVPEKAGKIIFQIGSSLNGLHDESGKINWDRFQKIMSFCSAVEIKLAQGAKQSGGILKALKNTKVIADIRGVSPHKDLISPNRFPYFDENGEADFLAFCTKLSVKSDGKPVGAKVVIANEKNIESLIITMQKTGDILDFITVDGGDGGSGAAPIALSILFGKKIDRAVPIVDGLLKKYKLRKKVKILASSKIYAPHASARVLALGADAIGNARSIMISAGCIRAAKCSGEHGNCPVGIATMNKSNRRAFAQAFEAKVANIKNYLHAHNHGIEQVAAICGVDSPHKLGNKHLVSTN